MNKVRPTMNYELNESQNRLYLLPEDQEAFRALKRWLDKNVNPKHRFYDKVAEYYVIKKHAVEHFAELNKLFVMVPGIGW